MKKVWIIAALVLIAIFAFVSCSSTPAASSAAAPASSAAASVAAASSAAPAASAAAVKGKVKVMFIPKNQGNPYFDAIVTGLKEAVTTIGADKIQCDETGPSTADATSQIEYVQAAVQNGYNVILIAANSNDALDATFDDARAKGVKIVIINGDIPKNETHRDAAILPTDFSKVGAAQIECLGSIINYEGEFAILSATTDAPDQNTWIEGMKATLKDPKYAKMKLDAVVYGDDQPEKSTTEMESLITKYPNLKGVIAPTTVGIAASAQVVDTKKLGDKIAVTGLGLPSQMSAFIKDGSVKQFQLWNPVDQGLLGAYFAYSLATGGVEAKEGATFDAGRLKTFTIGANNIIITGPPFTFDKSNIDNFKF
ncbi:MAG: rhamnose ABC transporter substrate-binding protein [Eubacteriales bacterium]